jgi:hypothetical protein
MSRRLGRIGIVFAVVVVVAVATTLILNSVAGAAGGTKSGSTTTVSIGGQGRLVQSPPGVTVTIKYSCFPAGYGPYAFGFGFVQVSDLTGHSGFASWNPTCNDKNQSLTIFVPGTFKRGGAAVDAEVCGFGCNGASREINIS